MNLVTFDFLLVVNAKSNIHTLADLAKAAKVKGAPLKRLPQNINGRKEGIHIHGSDWQQLAKEVSLSPARTVKRVGELCELLPAKADEARDFVASSPAGSHQILDQVVLAVEKCCRRIARQLAQLDRELVEPAEEAAAGTGKPQRP